jgi:antitoxin HigA-1
MPISPGEILSEEFMRPNQLTPDALARALRLPLRFINEIVLSERPLTAETALRLGRFFGTTAELWIGLQSDYDLRLARREKGHQVEREIEPLALTAAP